MNHKPLIVLLITALVGLSGCDDFIAEDISEAQIVLNAPANEATATQSEVTFWWEPLEVNTGYRLQVVTPSFEQAASLVLDTLLTAHQVSVELEPGTYAWRMRAENGTYRSAFSDINAFTVDFNPSPDNEDGSSPTEETSISLSSPEDNYITNQREITFRWIPSRSISGYELRLRGGVKKDFFTTESYITHTFERADGTFTWQVVGSCEGCEDIRSATRTLTLDFTPPNIPEMEAPEEGATMSGEARLSWKRMSSDVGYDLLFVYTPDSILLDSYPQTVPDITALPSYITLSDPEPGNYLWRVSSVDRAGNLSDFTPYRSFTFQ